MADGDERRRLSEEAAWARRLVEQVAEALERAAAQHRAVAGQLQDLSRWVRGRLHRGPPAAKRPALGVGEGPRREAPRGEG